MTTTSAFEIRRSVHLPIATGTLSGDLVVPPGARGMVLFAHGSGSGRHSPRNRQVAVALRNAGLATLLFDLLTLEEETLDARTASLRFDVQLLADRLVAVTDLTLGDLMGQHLPLGYFGASTGAAAALIAASRRPDQVQAVVSRGGRPDLAGAALRSVQAPTLLIVGGHDPEGITLNQRALMQLQCVKELVVVPRATHLFEEPGALEEVARLAEEWFLHHLGSRTG
jgi:putative phosphoribosyl transferase